MNKKLHRAVAAFALIASFITGCRSTDEYKKLAETGSKYAEVNELLTVSGKITIEASSEQLLREDRDLRRLEQTITPERYKEISDVDEKRLQLLKDLRQHNELLQAYFNKLFALADSKNPEAAKTEAEGIATNLNKIGKELKVNPLIENPGIFSSITNLIVSSQIKGALREELKERNQTIMLELTIQEELLNALSKSMEKEIAIIKLSQEQRLVIQPLAQEELVPSEDGWIATRKQILTMQMKSEELKEASKALGEFKSVFKDFVQGKLSIKKLNNFWSDVDSFLTIIESNKQPSNP